MIDLSSFKKEFDKILEFYGRKISEEAMTIWFQKLQHLNSGDYEQAIDMVTTREKSFPTPDIVLKYADDCMFRRLAREKSQDKIQAKNFFSDPSGSVHSACKNRVFSKFLAKLFSTPEGKARVQMKIDFYSEMHRSSRSDCWLEPLREAERDMANFGEKKDFSKVKLEGVEDLHEF